MTYRLEFTEDPEAFLTVAGELLAADPVVSTVMATVTQRIARDGLTPEHPQWWVSVHDAEDRVVGAAMRTAPFAPYPVFVLPMPEDAARALADAIALRGEDVTGVNGALPAARVLIERLAGHTGGEVEVHTQMRLHVLGDLVVPTPPPGRLRAATPADAELCLDWFRVFDDEASEQAGRRHGHGGEHIEPELIDGKIEREEIWLWEDGSGEVVHLTGHNPPSFGVARVGPVLTPKPHRGRGYASSAVAEVSRMLRDAGAEVCLYTDQANATSNKVYAAIGYVPVVDQANFVITR
jgi:hypothetical protein